MSIDPELHGLTCCFSDCHANPGAGLLRIAVWPPSDAPVRHAAGHEICLRAVFDPRVPHDPLEEHGRIPTDARCVFCAEPLPRVGKHPFALDILEDMGVERFWAHAECLVREMRLDDRLLSERAGQGRKA